MTARLLHAILLAAFWGGVVGTADALSVLFSEPSHREPALWWAAWWPWTLTGAAVGPFLVLLAAGRTTAVARERAPGAVLLAALVALGAATTATVLLGSEFLPAGPLSLPFWLGILGGTLVLAWLLLRLLLPLLAGKHSWLWLSFCSPLASALSIGIFGGCALLALNLPDLPATGAGPRGNSRSNPPPHIALLVLEGVSAERLGCYGALRNTSPELDRFAQDALRFTHAIAGADTAVLSRQAWIRGRAADPRESSPGPDLASLLRQDGYATACFFHRATDPPHERRPGFAHRTNAAHRSATERLLGSRVCAELSTRLGTSRPPAPTADSSLLEAAMTWLSERGDEPGFVLVELPGALPPHTPPIDLADRFRPQGIVEGGAGDAAYDAEILALDRDLGRFLAELAESDLLERTLVVVVGTPRPGGAERDPLRVPLLLRYPPRFPAGRACETVASAEDLIPTLLAAVAAPSAQESSTGQDLYTLLDHETARSVFAVEEREGGRALLLRSAKTVLVLGGGEDPTLYDLSNDPQRVQNLAEVEPGLLARNLEELRTQLAERNSRATEPIP